MKNSFFSANKHKLFKYSVISLVGVFMVLGTVIAARSGLFKSPNVEADEPTYTITLDDSNAASGLTSEYQPTPVTNTLPAKGDYSLTLTYTLAKKESDSHVTLATHGFMYNQIDATTYGNRITGLKSVTANYTSSSNLKIRTSIRNDGKEFGAPVELVSGTPLQLATRPYYFIIEAGDSEAKITSITFAYSCAENPGVYLDDLSGTYTGRGNDSSTYKMVLNGNSATIDSLDKQTNIHLSGTAELLSSTQAKCTFVYNTYNIYYTVSISADHRVLAYVSKTDDVGGAVAAQVAEIDFYKVYKVEDFEDYSEQGKGMGGSGRGFSSLYDTSGLRSQWHADWYTTGSYDVSYFGDSSWKLMGSTDFIGFNTTKGVSGSKTGVFKGNTNGLRYVQMKAPLGLPNIIGKGAYLSFWARAYSNSGLTTDKTTDTSIKVNAFYNQTVTKGNIGTKTAQDVTILGNGQWNRYTIALDSSKEYYSFGFYDNKSSQIYMAVDNVEIYTYNPYAEYIPPVAVTGVSVAPTAMSIELGQTGNVTATVSPSNATNKNVTWSSNNTSVATVDNNGVVTAETIGNASITATTADGGYTASCAVTVTAAAAPYPSGTYKSAVSVLSNSFDLVIAFGTRPNGMICVKLSNTTDAGATSVSYVDSTQKFTIQTTGSALGYTFGTITGTYDDVNNRLTGVACNGTIKNYVSGNGSIVCTVPTLYADCDGTTSQLQAMFKRRYNNGSWQVDSSNTDRITSNTTQFISGTGALKLRGTNQYSVALNFNSDLSSPVSVSNIHFWVYNSSSKDIPLRMWGYKAVNFGSNFETGSVTAKANGWTYACMGFTTASIYNFQIADFEKSGVYLTFDSIALF